MSRSPVHDEKRKKNLAVLGIIAALVALIFAITLIKIGGNVG